MLQPKIVVLDEPVSALDGLDPGPGAEPADGLQDETRVAYVFISHNLAVVELIADEVIVMYSARSSSARRRSCSSLRRATRTRARCSRARRASTPAHASSARCSRASCRRR